MEALKPIVDEAACRVTAELMLRDATEAAELAGEVREAIRAQFRNHLAAQIPPGVDIDAAMGAMATAAVDVFVEYLRRIPVPPIDEEMSADAGK
jgi:hypothetical protein